MTIRPATLATLAALVAGCSLADALNGSDSSESAGGGDAHVGAGTGGSGGRGGDLPGTIVIDDQDGPNVATGSSSASGPGSGGGSGAGASEFGRTDFPSAEQVCAQGPSHETTAHASVDDSNSYASPMLVRELTSDGAWKVGDPLPVRANEFLNAYGQRIEGGLLDADIDDHLHVGVDARVDPGADYLGRRLVRLAVSFTSIAVREELAPDVTFVMDSSESMDGEAVERLQAVVRGAGNTISTDRSVAALTTAATDNVVRDMTDWSGPQDSEQIALAAAALTSEVDFEGTLLQAFDIARIRANRVGTPGVVLVVTDGTNPLSPDGEMRVANERAAWPPVRVVGVGVGPARAYVDDLLDRVTDESGGAYFYAPSREAAQEELEARFTSLTQIAARDVELHLDFPATMEVVAVAGSAEPPTNDVDLLDGQNLGADSSMIFQIYLLAAAEVDCQSIGVSLSWKDPDQKSDDQATRYFPEDGTSRLDVPVWKRFDREPEPSASFMRVEAIVAAADAMRGPTEPRMQRAIDVMDGFLKAVPGDPVTALCAPLSRFCVDGNLDCRICATP